MTDAVQERSQQINFKKWYTANHVNTCTVSLGYCTHIKDRVQEAQGEIVRISLKLHSLVQIESRKTCS